MSELLSVARAEKISNDILEWSFVNKNIWKRIFLKSPLNY